MADLTIMEERREALAKVLESLGYSTAAEVLRQDRHGAIVVSPDSDEGRKLLEDYPELGERRCILYVDSIGPGPTRADQ